jgi:prophage antirepressor-like protein
MKFGSESNSKAVAQRLDDDKVRKLDLWGQFGEIRTAQTETGEPLFFLTDLCKVLNFSNPSMVALKLDDEDKPKLDLGLKDSRDVKNRLNKDDVDQTDTIDNLGRTQQVTLNVSLPRESNLRTSKSSLSLT